MAENQKREKMSLDFGIEDSGNGAEGQIVLDSLFATPKGDPDEITQNKQKQSSSSSSTTDSTTKKAVEQKKVEDNKEEKVNLSSDELLGLGNDEDNEDDQLGEDNKEGDNKDTKKEGEDVEENPLTSLTKDLFKLGIFSKGEDESDEDFVFDDPQEFLKRFQYEANKKASDVISTFLGRFGEDYQDMFDAVFNKGVKPQEYLQSFVKLQDVSSLDMTKEADQERVYREYWRRQSITEDRIEAKVQKAKVNGDLEEDAVEFQKTLVDQDSKELEAKKEQAEQLAFRKSEAKRSFSQSATKILNDKIPTKEFDGIPISTQLAQQALAFITQEKYKLANGDPLTEFDKYILELQKPENHVTKVKMALLMLNNFDLSKIHVKQANEKTTEAFKWAIKAKDGKSTTTNKDASTKKEAQFI